MSVLLLMALLPACSALAQPPVFRGLPSVKELVSREGLPCEPFLVTTEDGYSFWVFRVGNSTGPPVLLQHGIFITSDAWITRGRNKDLAYMMVDSGYDVYLGTCRGTAFCEKHAQYSKRDTRFWNFTFHEEGIYDIAAMIDAILKRTGANDVTYIGHSLGTTSLLVLASTRPEYNQKIRAAFLLSPIAFAPRPSDIVSPIVRFGLANQKQVFTLLRSAKFYEIWPRTEKTIQLIQKQCSIDPVQSYCMDFLGQVFGEHRSNLDKKNFGFQLSFAPAGSSTKTLIHLAQIYTTNRFDFLDLGCDENLKQYNSCKPPIYRLDRITTPVYLYWSNNDYLLSEWTVMRLASKLPNLAKVVKISDELFTHIDAFIGNNAKEQLYDPLLEDLARIYSK